MGHITAASVHTTHGQLHSTSADVRPASGQLHCSCLLQPCSSLDDGHRVDMNRDGIPDVLQQHQMNYPSPLTNYWAPVNYCAPPAGVMAVTGLDRNRDGVPDALQQSGYNTGVY